MREILTKFALATAICAVPGVCVADDRAEARTVAMPSNPSAVRISEEDFTIVIDAGTQEIWSGKLRIGGEGGNANFSFSKNEFAPPCPGKTESASWQRTSSFSVNFSLYRQNWQQEPDKFNVNLNWTRPLPACQGEGSDMLGFNRVVEIPHGRTIAIAGEGGLVLRMTRP